jgi:hypothetical protein
MIHKVSVHPIESQKLDQEVVAVASAPGVPIVRQPIRLTVADRDPSSGKGVGPKGAVELGRAKYWNASEPPSAAAGKELHEEERALPIQKPSYFREAMMGFAEPEEPFDPVPRP